MVRLAPNSNRKGDDTMPCDTRLKPNQTISQRKAEISEVVARVVRGLVSGKVKATVGPNGSIAFAGLSAEERADVTDACAYRRILATGNATAMVALQRAELIAGRKISLQGVASGVHSHDGGQTWHGSHKH